MSERDIFLNLRIKPGVCGFQEAWYLTGLHVDGLIYLEKVGHFKALGNPPKGAQRYFLTKYVLALCEDEKWMAKVVKLIREYNKGRNSTRTRKKEEAGTYD